MSGFNFDEKQVAKALMELPFGMPGGKSAQDAMMRPGNCVKSNERAEQGFPKYLGRIVKYSEDEVIIVSHCIDCCEKWVWTGNSIEYFRTWRCD